MPSEERRFGPLRPFPKLYAILDADVLAARELSLEATAAEMYAAGVRLIQYRHKAGAPHDVLHSMTRLRDVCPQATLILNDRPDLALLCGCDGVHVGQQDLPPVDVRKVLGPGREIGLSTHNRAQLEIAQGSPATYIAIGPVFATTTKHNPDPVVGIDGVRSARTLTSRPLVAIGGITRANAREAIHAGADSVAIITGLFAPGETVAHVVRDFLEILG